MSKLRSIDDLNLYRFFFELYESQSLTKAAKRSNKSKSYMSRKLQELRVAFDDELFVKSPSGLEPTEFASDIASKMKPSLELLRDFLEEEMFEPSNERKVTVALCPTVMHKFGYDIYQAIATEAPNAAIEILSWGSDGQNKILSGEICCAIHFMTMDVGCQMHQKKIREEECVVVVSKSLGVSSLAEAISLPFLSYRCPGFNESEFPLLKQLKQISSAEVVVEDKDLYRKLLEEKQLFSILPKSLSTGFDTFSLPRECNYDLAFCSKTSLRHSKKNTWLYGVFKEVLSSKGTIVSA